MSSADFLVLFDIDGTLIDPGDGITGGVSMALELHGQEVPDLEVLRSFVGPPLPWSLRESLGIDEALIPEIVESYRQEYSASGMSKSSPYPGIPELLQDLQQQGYTLAVVTQKPEASAQLVLQHHNLCQYFAAVYGDPGGESDGKIPIIKRAMADHHRRDAALMVGDRRFDIVAAQAVHIPSVGVSWGFASEGEFAQSGADYVVQSTAELAELIARVSAHE